MASELRIMRDVVDYEDIIEAAVDLDPIKAFGLNNGSRAAACTSPLYTKVRYGGEIIAMNLMRRDEDGKLVPTDPDDDGGLYAGGMSRVSTFIQATEGWSTRDQIERIVLACLRERYAFRLFSDAGLSGRLPMNDPALIAKMRDMRAELFRTLFNKVFLEKSLQNRFTPLERFKLQQYRDAHVTEILRGADNDGLDLKAEDEETIREIESKGKRVKPTYRPALTIMLHALPSMHTVFLYDQTRLCRSVSLFLEILSLFRKHGVRFEGTVGNLSMLNGAKEGELMGTIMAYMGQWQLEDVLLGSLRGIQSVLMSGLPHSTVPFWTERDKETKAAKANERLQDVEEMIRLFLSKDDQGGARGYTSVARQLDAQGVTSAGSGKQKARIWNPNTVKDNLTSHSLRGVQEIFGVEWQVLPPVSDDATYWQIQSRLLHRAELFDAPRGEVHLLAHFLRCSCGEAMGWQYNTQGYHRYSCERLKSVRDDYDTPHATLHHKRIEDFINGLMTFGYDTLIKELTDTADEDDLRQHLLRLSERAASIRARVERKEADQRAALAPLVEQLASKDSPQYEEILRSALMPKLMQDEEYKTLRAEISQLDQRREKLQQALEHSTPAAEFAALIESGRQWANLSLPRRNALLLDFFRGGRIVGSPPNEQLILQLRTYRDSYLAPIPIQASRHGKNWQRHLPNVEEWLMEATEPE